MSNLAAIANNIAAASAELSASNRWAAWKDREVMLKREREANRAKQDALMEGVRDGTIPFNPVDDYLRLLDRFTPLPCGCVTNNLSYEVRWVRECKQHGGTES